MDARRGPWCWFPPRGYGKTFQWPSFTNKPSSILGRRSNRTSSGSELEDDVNSQLAQLIEAVRELQAQNVETTKTKWGTSTSTSWSPSSGGRAETTFGGSRMGTDANYRKPRILLATRGSVAAVKFANLCRKFIFAFCWQNSVSQVFIVVQPFNSCWFWQWWNGWTFYNASTFFLMAKYI